MAFAIWLTILALAKGKTVNNSTNDLNDGELIVCSLLH